MSEENKELTKEELEKVTGGADEDFPCPSCGESLNYRKMKLKGFVYCCPRCETPVAEA